MSLCCLTDIEIDFTLDGSMLTCSINSSLTVDSIELLDSDGQRIIKSSKNLSFINYKLNTMITNVTYVCRVNSTLGTQNFSIFVLSTNYEIEETTSQSSTLVVVKQSPTIPVIPIAAASAGTILILLGIIFILVCIISLR